MACLSILTVDHGRKRSRRPWSDLPEDLLRLVVERLDQVYRIRFRAVCKNWLATPIHDIPPIHKLPWLMYYCFSPHHVLCSLFEPCRKLPYIMEEERTWDDERCWITAGSMLFRATGCASRCGWVLFSEKVRVVNSTLRHVYKYSIYYPFTKDVLLLPRLEMAQHDHNLGCLATFTSDPTSSDCVFIAPTVSYAGQYWVISTCSIGDKSWKTHNTPPVHAMAYMGGSVYCYNAVLGLSSFHIATQEWTFLFNESPLMDEHWIDDSRFMSSTDFFVAYGGHLHIVSLREFVEDDKVAECNILKYDWLDRAWKRMESLDGGALFLGKPSFGVSAGEQTTMAANRVYYFSSQTSTPKFLVYGSAGIQEKSQFPGKQTYCDLYKSCGDSYLWKSRSLLCESGNWMWMEPPLFMS